MSSAQVFESTSNDLGNFTPQKVNLFSWLFEIWFHFFISLLCFIMLSGRMIFQCFQTHLPFFFPPIYLPIRPKSPIIIHHFTKASTLFYRFTHRVMTNCFFHHENIVFPLISYLYCLHRPLRLAAAHSVRDAQTC